MFDPISLAVGFGAGAVVMLIVAYFVARNNKKQAIELLNVDFEAELKRALDSTTLDEEVKKILDGIKDRLK